MYMRIIILIVLHLYQCFNLVSATNDKLIFNHSETSAFRTVAKPKPQPAPAAEQQLPVASAATGAESSHRIEHNQKRVNENVEEETRQNQQERHSPPSQIQHHSQNNQETVASGKRQFDLNLPAPEDNDNDNESVPINADLMNIQQPENKQSDKGKSPVNEEADMQILEETAAPSNAVLIPIEDVNEVSAAEHIDKGKGLAKANEEARDDVQILDNWESVRKEKRVNTLSLKVKNEVTFKKDNWNKIRKRLHKPVEKGKLGSKPMAVLGLPVPDKDLPVPKKQRKSPKKKDNLETMKKQELDESIPVNADTMEVQQPETKQSDKEKNPVNENTDMQILEEETAAPSNAGSMPMDEENANKGLAAERIDKGKAFANKEATDDDVQILDKWEFVTKEKQADKLALKLNEDLTFKNKHWNKIRKRFHQLVEEGKLGREHMDMLGLPMPKKQREESPQKVEDLQKKQEQELADLVKRMETYNISRKLNPS